MSRAGAKARRDTRQSPTLARQVTVRSECPTCCRGVVHHIRAAVPGLLSYVDLHDLVCGCDHGSTGGSFCNFGDGWLEAA